MATRPGASVEGMVGQTGYGLCVLLDPQRASGGRMLGACGGRRKHDFFGTAHADSDCA